MYQFGYNLQVTETDDERMPHLMTDIAVTSSVESDREALSEIQRRQIEREAFRPHHAALQAARARQQTAEFKERYRQHRGGVTEKEAH